MFKKFLRKIWYTPQYWIYHLIYIPMWDFWDRLTADEVPLPPPICQICGEVDHREKYCPNLKKLEFLDE